MRARARACVCVSCVRAVFCARAACCPLLLVEEVAVHYHNSRENPGGYSIKVAYNGLLQESRCDQIYMYKISYCSRSIFSLLCIKRSKKERYLFTSADI